MSEAKHAGYMWGHLPVTNLSLFLWQTDKYALPQKAVVKPRYPKADRCFYIYIYILNFISLFYSSQIRQISYTHCQSFSMVHTFVWHSTPRMRETTGPIRRLRTQMRPSPGAPAFHPDGQWERLEYFVNNTSEHQTYDYILIHPGSSHTYEMAVLYCDQFTNFHESDMFISISIISYTISNTACHFISTPTCESLVSDIDFVQWIIFVTGICITYRIFWLDRTRLRGSGTESSRLPPRWAPDQTAFLQIRRPWVI